MPLSKKTKTEILEEYNKLLENYENLKVTSKFVHDPQSLQILEKVKDYTVGNLANSMQNLKTELNQALNQLSEKLLSEAQKFEEIQKAQELSRKNLEVQYHIQVAADTLENLFNENETKKRELEREFTIFQADMENGKEKVKREWSREQDEYDYTIKINRRREEGEYREEKAKMEKELAAREENIKKQEAEIQNLKKQVEQTPQQLEGALQEKEVEVTKKVKAEFENRLNFMKKDWETEEKIYELKIKSFEEQAKKITAENLLLRQESERANKKAQELAVKVIESGSKISPKTEERESIQKPQAQTI